MTPKTIMLIRHGEKLGDPETDDALGGAELSSIGAARAVALPTLFLPASYNYGCAISKPPSKYEPGFLATYQSAEGMGPPPRLPTPDFVFATADSKKSYRPKQTVRPTVQALGLHLDHTYKNKDKHIDDLANLMWTDTYENATVLICWHHGKMNYLAGRLGVVNAPDWPGTVFDQVWRIDYSDGVATLTVDQQQLLYGDRPQPGQTT